MADNLLIAPLYQNSKVSMNKMEVVYAKLFRILITPPSSISTSWELIHEQIKSVSGLLPYKSAGASVVQTFMGEERHFSKAGVGSHAAEVSITCNVNVSDDLKLVGYYEYREWCELVYGSYTGKATLKKDYEGGPINVYRMQKDSSVIHEWVFPRAIPANDETEHGDFNYEDDETIWGDVEYKFMCDGGEEKITM